MARADADHVGAAVAVADPTDRPGLVEKILVLGVCAVLLAVVHVADQRGRERNTQKAQQVLAERAHRAAERSSREAMTAPAAPAAPRTEGLGRETPIIIGTGPAWGPAGTVVSSARPTDRERAPAPAATATAPADVDTTLLLLLGGVGLSMTGAGLRLISRRSA